jgi:acyl-CoA thioesterase
VSVEASIAHTRPIHAHDVLVATATENHLGKTIGIYTIEIHNQHQKIVALFRGTAYRTADFWQ